MVLDPTFNAYFVRPDSHLASFADVKGNWAFYVKQVPAGYDLSYRFEDVRYTNWTKIPILLPGIKAALNFFMGAQKADTISIRSYFLDIYSIYFYITLFLYLPLFLYTFGRFVRTQLFPDKKYPAHLSQYHQISETPNWQCGLQQGTKLLIVLSSRISSDMASAATWLLLWQYGHFNVGLAHKFLLNA